MTTLNILVTGGCGFVGSRLVTYLVEQGHSVTAVDIMWFGCHIENPTVRIIQADFRSLSPEFLADFDALIHLANVANDPSVDLDPSLSWDINTLGCYQLATNAVKAGIRRFIYASSGSVYGVSNDDRVIESSEKVPISTYNKTKLAAEQILEAFAARGELDLVVLRPATVCGLSPRMRLDVVVNLLTFQALSEGVVTVLGGEQIRPHVHIDDMVRAYDFFLNQSSVSGTFNVGFENCSILELAHYVTEIHSAELRVEPSNDPRSYRQDSQSLIDTGFRPIKGFRNAVDELGDAFRTGSLVSDPRWYSVSFMKNVKHD